MKSEVLVLLFSLIVGRVNAQIGADTVENNMLGIAVCLNPVDLSKIELFVNDSIYITDTNYIYTIIDNSKEIKKRFINIIVKRKLQENHGDKVSSSEYARDQMFINVNKKYLEQVFKKQ